MFYEYRVYAAVRANSEQEAKWRLDTLMEYASNEDGIEIEMCYDEDFAVNPVPEIREDPV
jgi:hypothetical protein